MWMPFAWRVQFGVVDFGSIDVADGYLTHVLGERGGMWLIVHKELERSPQLAPRRVLVLETNGRISKIGARVQPAQIRHLEQREPRPNLRGGSVRWQGVCQSLRRGLRRRSTGRRLQRGQRRIPEPWRTGARGQNYTGPPAQSPALSNRDQPRSTWLA